MRTFYRFTLKHTFLSVTHSTKLQVHSSNIEASGSNKTAHLTPGHQGIGSNKNDEDVIPMDTHWYISFKCSPSCLLFQNHSCQTTTVGTPCLIRPSIASLRSLVLNPMFRAVSSLSPVRTQSWIPAWWYEQTAATFSGKSTNQSSDLYEYMFFLKKNYTTTLKLKESKILLWYFLIFNHPIYLISNYLETSTGSLASQLPWNCRLAELFNGILRLAVFRWIFLDLLVS